MFREDNFNKFAKQMEEEIVKHEYIYGDSWKTEEIEFLEQRFKHKYNEYNLTKNPNKLVSLVNLAMMVYVRKEK